MHEKTGHWFKWGDAKRFAESHGLTEELRRIRRMEVHPELCLRPRGRDRVHKGGFVHLLESRGIFDEFVKECWPGRLTPKGQSQYEKYRDYKASNDKLVATGARNTLDEVEELEERVAVDAMSFALEAQLRDFIIENLSGILIDGHRLRLFTDPSGRSGREYPTDVGVIDILAVDDAEHLVVFELKLGRGPDRALGQLTRYMGWVKSRLAGNREVRGVIVARAIDQRLRFAALVVPNISLFEYKVTFQLERITPVGGDVPLAS